MRKLASIQKIEHIEPIPGADAIELAKILGWQCVVKKGEFKAGDWGVYIEIDSVPPDNETFNFLWQKKDATEKRPRPSNFRIRTKVLRGALSQGLLMPIRLLVDVQDGNRQFELDQDLTEEIGIVKYEPVIPAQLQGLIRGNFPRDIVEKTDETRLQSKMGLLLEMRGRPYVATVKMDGSSGTYLIKDGEFHVCSRNLSLKEEEGNSFWKISRKYNIQAILNANPWLAIQGEVVGPKIQQNPLNLKDVDFYVFNVFDTQTHKYYNHDHVSDFCNQFGLKMVPVAFEGDELGESLEELLVKAEGKYEGTDNEREGIVIRPKQEGWSMCLKGRLSFKVISNKYLLKERD